MNLKTIYTNDFNNNQKYFLTIINEYKSAVLLPLDIDIFSGRQILEEIILECKSKKLSNESNNKLLGQKIDYLIKINYLVDEKQKKNLNYIKEKIYEKNADLVHSMAMETKDSFCLKSYFDMLVDKLNEFLDNENTDNSKNIKIITDNIFIELYNKGYSIKQIVEKINNLFSIAINNKDDEVQLPITSFPIDYIKETLDSFKLTEYINNLSFKDRINFIKKFYITKKNTYYLIVLINGIELENNIVECNKDIFLYNPKYNNPFNLQENQNHRDDIFNVNYENCSNACIKVDVINSNAGFKIGIEKIKNYINILKLFSPKNNLSVLENYKVLLDNKKKFYSFSGVAYSNNLTRREFERNVNPLDEEIFNDKNIQKLSKQVEKLISIDNDKVDDTQIVLLNSIKKYSEGLDNTNEQEAILKFWSSIESLFDNNLKINDTNLKFETMQEVISSYMTYASRYLPLHKLYEDLALATNLYYSNPKDRNKKNFLKFPIKLLKKLHLYKVPSKPIPLLPLIKYNKDIQENLNDYYYLQKTIDIEKYFNDINYSSKKIKGIKYDYKMNMVMIYRLRNQIIHNALSNEITTDFYYSMLKKIANFFLNAVLDEYINNKSLSINDIILKIYSKSILFIKNSESCTLLSLLF